jgi:hypothetical protein
LAEVAEEVADRFLTVIEDLAGRGLVDGVRHLTAEVLEGATQGFQKRCSVEGG